MIRKLSAALLFVLVTCLSATAQQQDNFTSKEVKTYKKSVKYFEKAQKAEGDKAYTYYNKAISTLKPVLDAHPKNEQLWDVMVEYYYYRYSTEENMVEFLRAFQKYGVKNAKTAEEKAIYQNMKIDTTKMYEYKVSLLDMCRQATFNCEKPEYASIYIRLLSIEPKYRPEISDEAQEKFSEAGKEYRSKNYLGAVKLYKEAYKLDSTYYRAVLYIGQSYANNTDYDNAIPWLEKAITMMPEKLEGRKYLVDVYMEQRKDQKAYDECINAILVHPDIGMFIRLETIAKRLGKEYNRRWITRDFEPNKSLQVPADSPWKYYYEAKKNIAPYCDASGVIVKENSLTKQKYMEAYCWEYMLQNTSDTRFSFAKKMMDAGFLDCYVLVSMYHVNVNDQFIDFAKNDADKIRKYISTYMME
ncbi:MAG: hypothetical protein AB1458_04950 [Bacteroidota bacterium]